MEPRQAASRASRRGWWRRAGRDRWHGCIAGEVGKDQAQATGDSDWGAWRQRWRPLGRTGGWRCWACAGEVEDFDEAWTDASQGWPEPGPGERGPGRGAKRWYFETLDREAEQERRGFVFGPSSSSSSRSKRQEEEEKGEERQGPFCSADSAGGQAQEEEKEEGRQGRRRRSRRVRRFDWGRFLRLKRRGEGLVRRRDEALTPSEKEKRSRSSRYWSNRWKIA